MDGDLSRDLTAILSLHPISVWHVCSTFITKPFLQPIIQVVLILLYPDGIFNIAMSLDLFLVVYQANGVLIRISIYYIH